MQSATSQDLTSPTGNAGSNWSSGLTSPARPTAATRLTAHHFDRATKIVCTLGPASNTEDTIRGLMQAGVDVFRLNFSHGTHDEHSRLLSLVRKVSEELGKPVGVLQDLCGPKVRIGVLPNGEVTLKEGELVRIIHGTTGEYKSDQLSIATTIVVPQEVLKPGHRVLLADGRVVLEVEAVNPDAVIARVQSAGKVRSKAGLAMPDSEISLPAITEKDKEDLAWGIKNDVNFVALSFVRSAEDVQELRVLMEKSGKVLPIISKIERKCALDVLPEIVAKSDAVMVARGDLGTEIPLEEIPEVQARIVDLALKRGIPCIVATEMLTSMVESEMPTRGEVTDVTAAAKSGADAVMLSQETAIGKHPVQVVRTMARFVDRAEGNFDFPGHYARMTGTSRFELSDPDVVALSACTASVSRGINCVLVCSHSGEMARLVAKYRPQVPVYAASDSSAALERMSLNWGVTPRGELMTDIESEKERAGILQRLAQQHFAQHPESKEFGAIVVSGGRNSTSEFQIKRIFRDPS